MLIMQVGDTAARTQLIEEQKLATVVLRQRASEGDGSSGSVERTQFSPKGIPGLCFFFFFFSHPSYPLIMPGLWY